MEQPTVSELAEQLARAKKQVAYYKRIAEKSEKTRLQETENQSRLIQHRNNAEEKPRQARQTADLTGVNSKLQAEIAERKHAEAINKTLFEISSAVNTTFNLDDLYHSIHKSLSRIIDVTNFYIAIVDSKERTLHFPYHVDEKDDDFGPITNFDMNSSLTGKVVLQRAPLLFKKKEIEALESHWGPISYTWMGVPLIIKDTVIGVMVVQSYSDPQLYSKRDLEVLAAVSDQTAIAIERKRAADNLRKSEQRFRRLFEQSNDAIIIHRSGRIIDVNQRTCEMLGYNAKQLLTMDITNLYEKKDPAAIESQTTDMESGKTGYFETLWLKADGTSIDVEVSSRVADEKKGIIQSIGRDISLRKRAEEERLKVEKLESLGILSGGIAHDFNNLLSVILGNISIAQSDSSSRSESLSFLKEAEKACLRSKALTRQLITFSPGGAPMKKTCPISPIIKTSAAAAIGAANSKSVLDLPDDLWPVECDPEQIKHALNNLMKNAVEAMPAGGTIRIQAENCRHKDPATDGNRELSLDKYVHITIKDQGVGIPAELQDKIFDPYFSTKQRGTQKGMGLGLTTAYSIIDKHDGHMEIRSIENRGTTVEVFLPAATSIHPVQTFTVETNKSSSISTKGKFILLMDDEKMIIDLARELLKRMGYWVGFALHGAEAIELFKKSLTDGRPFDAVILDLTIKRGISGLQTLKEILKLAPNTRVIVSSGYSNDPVMTAPQSYGFVAALPKPYNKKELQTVLSDVIGHLIPL